MKAKPFAVRVSIAHNGMSSHSTYVRPESSNAPSCQAWAEFALGNLLALVMTGYTDSLRLGNGITGNRIDVSGAEILGFSVDIVDANNTVDAIDKRFREFYGM